MRETVGKILTDADAPKLKLAHARPISGRAAAMVAAPLERSLHDRKLARYGLTTREIKRMTDEQCVQALDTFNAAIKAARDAVRASLKRRPKQCATTL